MSSTSHYGVTNHALDGGHGYANKKKHGLNVNEPGLAKVKAYLNIYTSFYIHVLFCNFQYIQTKYISDNAMNRDWSLVRNEKNMSFRHSRNKCFFSDHNLPERLLHQRYRVHKL